MESKKEKAERDRGNSKNVLSSLLTFLAEECRLGAHGWSDDDRKGLREQGEGGYKEHNHIWIWDLMCVKEGVKRCSQHPGQAKELELYLKGNIKAL